MPYKEPQDHLKKNPRIDNFFGVDGHSIKKFDNFQEFDFEGLLGRLCSSSYMPSSDDEGFDEVKKSLLPIFDKFQENGKVRIDYSTKLYISRPWSVDE